MNILRVQVIEHNIEVAGVSAYQALVQNKIINLNYHTNNETASQDLEYQTGIIDSDSNICYSFSSNYLTGWSV